MKISFVIPAYNEENYLGECLESIKNAELDSSCDIEIIVVNNASTDSTGKVADSFEGVKVVNEPRKGLLFARQAGFKAADGELIANIDADTILTRDWIKTVAQEFAGDKKLVALSGPFIYYDLPLITNVGVRIYYYFGYISYLLHRFVFRIGALLQGGNFVVRRTALEKIDGYNLSLSFYGEDTDIAKRLRAVGKVRFTFRLPVYSSGRRLKTEGIINMMFKYPANYIWVTLFKRPFHSDYLDIRQKKEIQLKTNLRQMKIAMSLVFIGFIIMALGIASEATLDHYPPGQIRQYFITKKIQVEQFGITSTVLP